MPPVPPSKASQSSSNGTVPNPDRLSAPTHSPTTNAAPSRPRSILNVSRSSALSPSLSSSQTPLNQLSTSPSSRSIVSNGTARNGAGGGGALNRLKRVASNASIASSSSKFISSPQQQRDSPSTAAATPTTTTTTTTNEGICSAANDSPDPSAQLQTAIRNGSRPASVRSAVNEEKEEEPSCDAKAAQTSQQGGLLPPAAIGSDTDGNESINNTITKRPRSPLLSAGGAANNNKQARRRTWFGFGGVVDSDGDVKMADAQDSDGKGKAKENVHAADQAAPAAVSATDQAAVTANPPLQEDGDTAMEEANGTSDTASSHQAPPAATAAAKGWLPWRGAAPSDANQAASSYTDTIRRYVSETSAYNAYWKGWPIWKEEAGETKEGGQDSGQAAEAQSSEGQMAATPQESNAEPSNSLAANGGQANTASRWWPAWGTRPAEETAAKVEDAKPPSPAPTPPTPAERVKAEALARIEAKDAVLNNATRSTWINYFSSRSAVPSSTVQENDGGPEIMRLSIPPAEQAEAKPKAAKGKTGETSKEPQAALKVPAATGKTETKKGDKSVPKVDPAPPISRPSTPLTTDKERAKQVKAAAAAPKGKKGDPANKPSKGPPPPNLLLPSFDDIFTTAPRALPPSKGMLEKTLSYLFSRPSDNTLSTRKRKPSLLSIGASRGGGTEEYKEHEAQTRLPRLWSVVSDKERAVTKGCKGMEKVSIIGIHGWFSQGPLRNLFGEPTGTSIKFATMMTNAVKEHFTQAGQSLSDEQLSVIALEADGLVADRVNKSFSALLNNPKWLADVLSSNVVCVAAHSQGSVVATHLLARLIEQRHLDPKRTKVVLLAMCGIHHGPFTHLRSSVASYYMNTFETPAAKELFEFQNSKSPVSMMYAASLRIVVNAGVKLVYVASMDDQVVPLYSALNSSASHPSILRAIFCDGAAFPRVDFLTNLLSFCAAVRNAGLSDHNLLTLLSASVAGSLYGGAGHSIVYEEPQVYSLAVRYVMEVTSPNSYPTTKQSEMQPPALQLEPFSTADNAKWNSNPFALPWSLRGLLEDEVVRRYFDSIIEKLLSDYNEWAPTTKTLKDVQFRLEPMRLVSRQPTPSPSSNAPSNSKL